MMNMKYPQQTRHLLVVGGSQNEERAWEIPKKNPSRFLTAILKACPWNFQKEIYHRTLTTTTSLPAANEELKNHLDRTGL